MAQCEYCGQEMLDGVGCTFKRYDVAHGRIPVKEATSCTDCAAPFGTLHHPGCDNERCPICGGQLISCGCIEDDESEDSGSDT